MKRNVSFARETHVDVGCRARKKKRKKKEEGERGRERERERGERGWLMRSGRYRYRGLDSKFKSYYLVDAIRWVRIGGQKKGEG